MSDDALDYAFEEELQAAEGYREMWVRYSDGRKQRVSKFPDTPEWREAADLTAIEFRDDPHVELVWHIPMGTRAGSLVPGQPVGGGKGLGARPDPPCCEPETYPGPSGVRLRHSGGCRSAGEPYREGASRLAHRLAIQTRRVGMDDPTAEPAGGILASTGPECPAHPAEAVYGCITCSERRL